MLACIRFFFVFTISVLLTQSAVAQTSTTEATAGTQQVFDTPVSGLGLQASLCTGMGLSFRQHLAGIPLAFQLTSGVWKAGTTLFDIGFEVQYDLAVSTNRLYAVAGGGYYYSGNGKNDLVSPSRFGAGIGYEVPFSKSMGLNLDLMVTFFEPDATILPLPSIGWYIYFK